MENFLEKKLYELVGGPIILCYIVLQNMMGPLIPLTYIHFSYKHTYLLHSNTFYYIEDISPAPGGDKDHLIWG